MRLRTAFTAITVMGLSLVAPATAYATATADGVVHAKLSGASVVPGPGDANGKGTFKAKIKNGEFCYTLKVKKLGEVTSAGIYTGEAGTTGDQVVALETGRHCTTIVADADDTTETLSESEAAALLADGGNYYVQVQTDEFPDGAVRGQLR
jgi:hypothetical protein